MSIPTMMICLRKDRIGEGVSEVLAFIFILFLVGERGGGGGQTAFITCTWSAHTCWLRTGEVELKMGTKCWEIFFGRGVDDRFLGQI